MKYKDEIIKDIKAKKELRDISDTYMESFLKIIIPKKLEEKFDSAKSFSQLKRTGAYKEFFKTAREKLRKIYGVFKEDINREELLEQRDYEAILKSHQSTRERIDDYPKIIKEIYNSTKAKSILDLGCGLNPIAIYPHKNKIKAYYAGEISKDDVDLLNNFFKQENIPGKAFIFDLITDDFSKLPKADVCLLFKVLDALEILEENISLKILRKIPCTNIVVSFTTKSISGKKSFNTDRSWFERILKTLKYNYKTFETSNEIFYIIKKD